MVPGADVLRIVLVTTVAVVPVAIAAASPLLAGRDAVWVAGGFAGIVALSLLFVQPLLASGALPGPQRLGWHRLVGAVAVALAVGHVIGLYLYSPDDIMDALLLESPTPFSVYGVAGLVLLMVVALLGGLVRAVPRPVVARRVHSLVGLAAVVCAAWHAVLIDGAMEMISKLVLCAGAVGAAAHAVVRLYRPLLARWRRRAGT
ncbi:ferric reductase [Methylobrevis albus]|uniref:Ferric reductase n=1 Tax=Methylobrevis albus TaxID=2793297 RepID=A0A931HZF6_9HYPH|nr:ferric reductase [Methylobrevis albus]MBH0236937.1 ferric reductase [Methylobrevis albus]